MKPSPQGEHFDVEERFGGALETAARVAFWGGLLATVAAVSLLVFTFFTFGGSNPPQGVDQAVSNIELFQKLLIAGVVAVSIGGAVLFWGEELFGAIQLIAAGLLFFMPAYLPSIIRGRTSAVGASAMDAAQKGGAMLGMFAIVLLAAEVFIRVKERTRHGVKADFLKFGKGIKEEKDIKNVFMGKCWQLPFCRKFVRERCPIYHAKRTCWRERVGCMCEEEVIRHAMENRTIPKDAVIAAKMIPKNNRLTAAEKFERCRHCVIYNEHQKHKYSLALPIMLAGFIGFYALMRGPLLGATDSLLSGVDQVLGQATFSKAPSITKTLEKAPLPFNELLLICFLIIVLAYGLKLLEFVFFKLKI